MNDKAMDDKTLKGIRQKLLQLKSVLEEKESEFSESADIVVLDQTRVGRLSRMDAMQTQQMAMESARRRQQQLLKIEGALTRIKSGEYGYCFVCGEEIVLQRLIADPTSTRCIQCVE